MRLSKLHALVGSSLLITGLAACESGLPPLDSNKAARAIYTDQEALGIFRTAKAVSDLPPPSATAIQMADRFGSDYARPMLQEALKLLTVSERATVGGIDVTIDPSQPRLDSMFIDGPAVSPRMIRLSLGSVFLQIYMADAQMVDQYQDASSPLFSNDYALFLRQSLAGGQAFNPDPLPLAGWDRDLLTKEQKRARDRIFDETMFYIIAHEVGHARFDHRYAVDAETRQRHELEADVFAVELLNRRARAKGRTQSSVWAESFLLNWTMAFGSTAQQEAGTHPPGLARIRHVVDSELKRLRADEQRGADGDVAIERLAAMAEIVDLGLRDLDGFFARLVEESRSLTVSELRRQQRTQ